MKKLGKVVPDTPTVLAPGEKSNSAALPTNGAPISTVGGPAVPSKRVIFFFIYHFLLKLLFTFVLVFSDVLVLGYWCADNELRRWTETSKHGSGSRTESSRCC